MPNPLQGLNLVYPPPLPSDHPSQDTLTPPPGFPDLSAQLDLWTNLSFASDEPFVDKDRKQREFRATLDQSDQDLGEGDETEEINEKGEQDLIMDGDKPAQTPADNGILSVSHPEQGSTNSDIAQASFDLGSFLAGFGIDPFLVPPRHSSTQSDLSSLLPSSHSSSSSSPTDISAQTVIGTDPDVQPPTKRTRTRKGSTAASQAHAIAPSALQQPAISNHVRAVSEFSDDHDPLSTPLTAAEDKRRRNTAASARFRAKKKEREQALEKRSKELESKVTELERECEGLRRENGWLKGLVVGVTGSNPSDVPQLPGNANGSGDLTGVEAVRGKRKRDVESSSEGR